MQTDEFIIIHQGFDGLDFAVKANISERMAGLLASLKQRAIDQKEPQLIEIGKSVFHVELTGMGCYTFRLSTGPMGYSLGIKTPNREDPWGLRVSFNALPLAIHGWEACTRQVLEDLAALGCSICDDDISISRIDYAIDVLFPEPFVLDPKNIIRHSRMKARVKSDLDTIETGAGPSYIRVGSISGKQIAIYDKRADVLDKRKSAWWMIWNENLKRLGLEAISKDNTKGRIWRFEFRAGKNFVAYKRGVKTFTQLRERGGDVFVDVASSVRYAQPSDDCTRSRWPDHPVYALVRSVLQQGLHEMISGIEASAVREVFRNQLACQLLAQMSGTGLAFAVAAGIDTDETHGKLPDIIGDILTEYLREVGDELPQRLQKVRDRYRFIGDEPKAA